LIGCTMIHRIRHEARINRDNNGSSRTGEREMASYRVSHSRSPESRPPPTNRGSEGAPADEQHLRRNSSPKVFG
jgi:hypothetical protein